VHEVRAGLGEIMTPRVEKLLTRVTFWTLSVSIAFYLLGTALNLRRLQELRPIFVGSWSLEIGFACFLVFLIFVVLRLPSIKLKGLLGLVCVWFITISAQAFHSLPTLPVAVGIGVVVEFAAIAIHLAVKRHGAGS
jgi:hypothetical protein